MVDCGALEPPKLLELQPGWVAWCHGGVQKVWGQVDGRCPQKVRLFPWLKWGLARRKLWELSTKSLGSCVL